MNTFIRKANSADANDLLILNEKFNGKQDISKEMIERSLESNTSEEVFVAVNNERVIGFCCIRIYSSFCYSVSYAEITEIYVDDEGIVLKKYAPACIFCGSADEIVNFKGKKLCSECLAELQK